MKSLKDKLIESIPEKAYKRDDLGYIKHVHPDDFEIARKHLDKIIENGLELNDKLYDDVLEWLQDNVEYYKTTAEYQEAHREARERQWESEQLRDNPDEYYDAK